MITFVTVIGIKGKEEEQGQGQAKGEEEEQETWRQWYSCRELLKMHQKRCMSRKDCKLQRKAVTSQTLVICASSYIFYFPSLSEEICDFSFAGLEGYVAHKHSLVIIFYHTWCPKACTLQMPSLVNMHAHHVLEFFGLPS